jgi:hypothetical protein
MERSNFSSTHLEREIIAIITMKIDLPKNVLQCLDESGKPALVLPTIKRVASPLNGPAQ